MPGQSALSALEQHHFPMARPTSASTLDREPAKNPRESAVCSSAPIVDLSPEVGAAFDAACLAVFRRPVPRGSAGLRSPAALFVGFTTQYRRLVALPRRTRRSMERRWKCTLTVIALWLALGQPPAWAATMEVAAGAPPAIHADGKCSLAEAIVNANRDLRTHLDCAAGAGADTIVLPTNSLQRLGAQQELPQITSRIVVLGRRSTLQRNTSIQSYLPLLRIAATGDLTLDKLTISGVTPSGVTGGDGVWNAGGSVTLVDSHVVGTATGLINAGGSAVLRRSTITGSGTTLGPDDTGGGAIRNSGTLVLTNSAVTGNEAVFDAPGISNGTDGVLTIVDSVVADNVITYEGIGGGIENWGTLVLVRSTVSGNSADIGGGIFSGGRANATLVDSTISGNRALGAYGYGGGGIAIAGTVTVDNCTVSNNAAALGGGLYVWADGALTLANSTVTGNTTRHAGGGMFLQRGTITVRRSIVSGNLATAYPGAREVYVTDFYASTAVAADDYNVFGHDGDAGVTGFTPGTTDIVPTKPLDGILLPLADNGGGIRTHALAIGASPYDEICPTTDQRGNPRPRGPACDVGAFEGVAVLCSGLVTTMVGTIGGDRLTGTAGRDVISGLNGDDIIAGLGGNDVVCGGFGADLVRGGPGLDQLFGEPGNDRLFGDGGNDTLIGGADQDVCDGGAHSGAGDTAATCETVRNVP
jgi:hypothetical protein